MADSMLNRLIFDPAYLIIGCIVFIVVLLILIIVLFRKLKKSERRYDTFMRGADAESLEERVIQAISDIEGLQEEDKKNKKGISVVKKSFAITYQKMGLVKYDSLAGLGGKSSFALTMLTQENNGFVLNVIHSREGSYPYIKRVENGVPESMLGTEEQESFNEAMGKS